MSYFYNSYRHIGMASIKKKTSRMSVIATLHWHVKEHVSCRYLDDSSHSHYMLMTLHTVTICWRLITQSLYADDSTHSHYMLTAHHTVTICWWLNTQPLYVDGSSHSHYTLITHRTVTICWRLITQSLYIDDSSHSHYMLTAHHTVTIHWWLIAQSLFSLKLFSIHLPCCSFYKVFVILWPHCCSYLYRRKWNWAVIVNWDCNH